MIITIITDNLADVGKSGPETKRYSGSPMVIVRVCRGVLFTL